MDDMKNGKKSSSQVTASKRYSIDNYCSNWLSNACKPTHLEAETNTVIEKNQSFPTEIDKAINDKPSNGHEQHLRVLETNKLLHRRSLSENIIPFPPHTTPSDKARCHLINRRNSQLNASSGKNPLNISQNSELESLLIRLFFFFFICFVFLFRFRILQ